MNDAVVSHHLDGFRSGVARFNDILARRLGIPLLGIDALREGPPANPLLSFKVAELDDTSSRTVEDWIDGAEQWDVFFHVYDALELEHRLVNGATRVFSGNAEIQAGLDVRGELLWAPGLILDERAFPETELSVFSFGMAHKLRIDMFARLRELLDATDQSYALYVSAANHETASLRDAELVFDELHEIFPDTLYFLGNLSDLAVVDQIRKATFFATFFARGLRANNTSVAAALALGSVVVTNLDEHSPSDLVHFENIIDLEQTTELPFDPVTLERLSRNARDSADARSWDRLIERILS